MSNINYDVMLEGSRFWFQKVLVPIMVCVGVAGNTITVMVLTRRRMRSSTNIYLSALGIADIIYLLFVFLLSFKHSSNIHDRRYELYWRFYGLTHWLCDAASSTSVWLTVSFTIERYIAVCHPMKGKFLCTVNRAKTVTVIVYIFCILTTASTTFEYQLTMNDTTVCKNCTKSDLIVSNNTHVITKNVTRERSVVDFYSDPNKSEILKKILENCTENHPHIIYVYPLNYQENPKREQIVADQLLLETNLTNSSSCCVPKYYIDVEYTNLGKNERYNVFISWYSAIFWGLLPLLLIAIFNSFLIHAVYLSQKTRRTMTNRVQVDVTSTENRITIMLISVVVMFLICQTPTASFLIYYNFNPPKTKEESDIQKILGNVFNSLLAVNASCNFLFYSIMSKKFRTTFKQLFRKKPRIQESIQLSSMKSNSTKFNPSYHGISRNPSEYRTPRNLETSSLTSVPRSGSSTSSRQLGKAKSTDLVV